MPSIAAHMICAKLVAIELNIKDKEFIKGNLLPDIIDKEDSHKKIQGKHYLIPNIDYFIDNLNLNDNLHLGYLSHLLLDKYFLEEYICNVSKDNQPFLNKTIYKEYDIINYQLLKRFNIDVTYLNDILKDFSQPIDTKKYEQNIKFLNSSSVEENLQYLNIDDFSDFLIQNSKNIATYLKKIKCNRD